MEPKQEHKLISHADILLIVGILILAVAGLFCVEEAGNARSVR